MIQPSEGLCFPDGNVLIVVRSARTGAVLEEIHTKNHVTASGRNLARDLLSGHAKAPYWLAMGGSTAVETDSQTALVTEMYRLAIDSWVATDSRVEYSTFMTATQGNSMPYAIRELGIFSGPPWLTTARDFPLIPGRMLARAGISGITKTADCTLTITWELLIKYVTKAT